MTLTCLFVIFNLSHPGCFFNQKLELLWNTKCNLYVCMHLRSAMLVSFSCLPACQSLFVESSNCMRTLNCVFHTTAISNRKRRYRQMICKTILCLGDQNILSMPKFIVLFVCLSVRFIHFLVRVPSYKSCIVKCQWFEPRLRDAKVHLKGIYTFFHASVKPLTILIKWIKHNCNWIYCLKQESAQFVW